MRTREAAILMYKEHIPLLFDGKDGVVLQVTTKRNRRKSTTDNSDCNVTGAVQFRFRFSLLTVWFRFWKFEETISDGGYESPIEKWDAKNPTPKGFQTLVMRNITNSVGANKRLSFHACVNGSDGMKVEACWQLPLGGTERLFGNEKVKDWMRFPASL